MSELLITNFQKSPSAGGSPPPAPLTLDFGDLKSRDELCFFFRLIMTKLNFKKSVMASFQWRRFYYGTE